MPLYIRIHLFRTEKSQGSVTFLLFSSFFFSAIKQASEELKEHLKFPQKMAKYHSVSQIFIRNLILLQLTILPVQWSLATTSFLPCTIYLQNRLSNSQRPSKRGYPDAAFQRFNPRVGTAFVVLSRKAIYIEMPLLLKDCKSSNVYYRYT